MPVEERSAIEQTLLQILHYWVNVSVHLGLNNRNIRKQTFITPIAVQPEDVEIGIVQKADWLS